MIMDGDLFADSSSYVVSIAPILINSMFATTDPKSCRFLPYLAVYVWLLVPGDLDSMRTEVIRIQV
jgi:hypothetical protein